MINCKQDLINTYIENDNGELLDLYLAALYKFNCLPKALLASYCKNGRYIVFDATSGTLQRAGNYSGGPYVKKLTITDFQSVEVSVVDELQEYLSNTFGGPKDTAYDALELMSRFNVTLADFQTEKLDVNEAKEALDSVNWHGNTDIHAGGPFYNRCIQVPVIKPKTKVKYVKCEESINDIAKAMIDGETLHNKDGNAEYSWSGRNFIVNGGYNRIIHVEGEFYRRVETEVTLNDEISDFFQSCNSETDCDYEVSLNGGEDVIMLNEAEFKAMCSLVRNATKPE